MPFLSRITQFRGSTNAIGYASGCRVEEVQFTYCFTEEHLNNVAARL